VARFTESPKIRPLLRRKWPIQSEFAAKNWGLVFHLSSRYGTHAPNGLRYLRWGGDGEAVQPEKW